VLFRSATANIHSRDKRARLRAPESTGQNGRRRYFSEQCCRFILRPHWRRQKWTRRFTWNGEPSSESGSSNTGGRYRRNSIRRRRGINGCERISRITGKKGREFKSGKTLLVARKWASGCKEIIVADRKGALVPATETNNCAGNSPPRSA
jgi:hypothetical protein